MALYKFIIIIIIIIINHLINVSGLDNKWQFWMLSLKPVLRQYIQV